MTAPAPRDQLQKLHGLLCTTFLDYFETTPPERRRASMLEVIRSFLKDNGIQKDLTCTGTFRPRWNPCPRWISRSSPTESHMPSKNKPSIDERKAVIGSKPCTVPGCENLRSGLSSYCGKHHHPAVLYGHPHGRSITRKEYAKEIEEVTALLATNPDHPGLTTVLRWLNEWLTQAATGEAPCGNETFGRMHRQGLPALEILTEICAVWVYSQRNPHRLPDDMRLTYALARNPVRLATFEQATLRSGRKMTRQPKTLELRETGKRIRHTLALFLINIHDSLKRREEQTEAVRSSLSIPFN